jgi:Protein of unknown function DUF86.
MAKNGVLDMEFAQQITKSVGLRNKIIHEYDVLTAETLFNTIAICLVQYRDYYRRVIHWVDKNYNT